jgi:hypothetical protein
MKQEKVNEISKLFSCGPARKKTYLGENLINKAEGGKQRNNKSASDFLVARPEENRS